LFEEFRGRMPSHESIVDQAVQRATERLVSGPDDLRAKFSAIFSVAQSEAMRANAGKMIERFGVTLSANMGAEKGERF